MVVAAYRFRTWQFNVTASRNIEQTMDGIQEKQFFTTCFAVVRNLQASSSFELGSLDAHICSEIHLTKTE
jgi:hypothetical protein